MNRSSACPLSTSFVGYGVDAPRRARFQPCTGTSSSGMRPCPDIPTSSLERADAGGALGSGSTPNASDAGLRAANVLAIHHKLEPEAPGRMFRVEGPELAAVDGGARPGRGATNGAAQSRVIQHKGESECLNRPRHHRRGVRGSRKAERTIDSPASFYAKMRFPPEAPGAFVREALRHRASRSASRLGANPFHVGLRSAALDTHIVRRRPGSRRKATRAHGRAPGTSFEGTDGPALPDDVEYNPGGPFRPCCGPRRIRGRTRLFAAMRRPRDLCDQRTAHGRAGSFGGVGTFVPAPLRRRRVLRPVATKAGVPHGRRPAGGRRRRTPPPRFAISAGAPIRARPKRPRASGLARRARS